MGLFGTLLRVGGKVLKKAASVATHGASDHVLKAAKSLGAAKKLLVPGKGTTIGMQALANRVVPQVRITPTLHSAASGNASPGTYSKKKPKRRRRRTTAAARAVAPRARATTTRRNQTTRPRAARGRAAPRGGLNLRAMSQSWNAAGKPGTWRQWVSNPASQIRNAR